MRGDFSRRSFDPDKQFDSVRLQQGRVLLDADWNALGDVLLETNDRARSAIVGQSGTPEGQPALGLGIGSGSQNVSLSPGQLFVDGIHVEIPLDDPDAPPADQAYKLRLQRFLFGRDGNGARTELGLIEGDAGPRKYLLYVEVRRRGVNAIQDPTLREVGLGGPDTTTRLQKIWQVKAIPVTSESLCDSIVPRTDVLSAWPDPLPADAFSDSNSWKPWTEQGTMSAQQNATGSETDDPCIQPDDGGYRGLENRLYRVEVQHVFRTPGPRQLDWRWSRKNASTVAGIEPLGASPTGVSESIALPQGNTINTARRVTLTLTDVLNTGSEPFPVDSFVEILDDELELRGLPGPIGRIESYNPETKTLVILVDDTDPGLTPGQWRYSAYQNLMVSTLNLRVTQWDVIQRTDLDSNYDAADLDLEDNLQVSFKRANLLTTYDAWEIPTRTGVSATDSIQWPPPGESLSDVTPMWPERHAAALQMITVNDGGQIASEGLICLPRFFQMIDYAPPVTVNNIRFLGVELATDRTGTTFSSDFLNDALNTGAGNMPALDRFAGGFRLQLSGEPMTQEYLRNGASLTVELDVPYWPGENNSAHGYFRPGRQTGELPTMPLGYQTIKLAGEWLKDTTSEPDQFFLRWAPSAATKEWLLSEGVDLLVSGNFSDPLSGTIMQYLRAHIRVEGSFVWEEPTEGGVPNVFLDGTAFGDVDAQNNERVAINFPTGTGKPQGDFHMWFHLEPARLRDSTVDLTITLTNNPGISFPDDPQVLCHSHLTPGPTSYFYLIGLLGAEATMTLCEVSWDPSTPNNLIINAISSQSIESQFGLTPGPGALSISDASAAPILGEEPVSTPQEPNRINRERVFVAGYLNSASSTGNVSVIRTDVISIGGPPAFNGNTFALTGPSVDQGMYLYSYSTAVQGNPKLPPSTDEARPIRLAAISEGRLLVLADVIWGESPNYAIHRDYNNNWDDVVFLGPTGTPSPSIYPCQLSEWMFRPNSSALQPPPPPPSPRILPYDGWRWLSTPVQFDQFSPRPSLVYDPVTTDYALIGVPDMGNTVSIAVGNHTGSRAFSAIAPTDTPIFLGSTPTRLRGSQVHLALAQDFNLSVTSWHGRILSPGISLSSPPPSEVRDMALIHPPSVIPQPPATIPGTASLTEASPVLLSIEDLGGAVFGLKARRIFA